MAQVVQYFQNGFVFKEGPFVACCLTPSGHYRVEVQYIGHYTSALPDSSIYTFCSSRNLDTRGSEAVVLETVDRLNQAVEEGKIILEGKCWVSANDSPCGNCRRCSHNEEVIE